MFHQFIYWRGWQRHVYSTVSSKYHEEVYDAYITGLCLISIANCLGNYFVRVCPVLCCLYVNCHNFVLEDPLKRKGTWRYITLPYFLFKYFTVKALLYIFTIVCVSSQSLPFTCRWAYNSVRTRKCSCKFVAWRITLLVRPFTALCVTALGLCFPSICSYVGSCWRTACCTADSIVAAQRLMPIPALQYSIQC